MDYGKYEYLTFERPSDGVLLITINRPERLNATNKRLHWELSTVWLDVDADDECRVAVITGAGKAFSAGGDLDMVIDQAKDFKQVAAISKEAADLVYNIVNCQKVVISAINGVAVGAGLAAALMADISVIAEDARLTDGHLRLGVGAGDHAAIVWPILCGMAKAKYYLLTAEFIDGKEAERIGLVSLCRPVEEVLSTALGVAEKLAVGPQHALRWTKRSLNHWIRDAGPIFEASLAYEMLNFFDDDVLEGAQAIKEKRAPRFPSVAGP
ncbi:enoyl-CoA hydratase/isomerase family protein [Pseudonocardia sp. WMMC193]|uniref:enoyl-CoA hydratase/isomerase family protein n=1 Tax=Pseudonocardia sp. WMMC193 TaxID=2911965 RepID=UPI001F3A3A5C|nr:enoyl-CoA hydratase/isomerase family protein [Pseudonocardia sp. WMMC193]MCF7550751.1 enoyl-CoA hydratase/isomerase family protein [Pseudonocardia sp. WMMC193]